MRHSPKVNQSGTLGEGVPCPPPLHLARCAVIASVCSVAAPQTVSPLFNGGVTSTQCFGFDTTTQPWTNVRYVPQALAKPLEINVVFDNGMVWNEA